VDYARYRLYADFGSLTFARLVARMVSLPVSHSSSFLPFTFTLALPAASFHLYLATSKSALKKQEMQSAFASDSTRFAGLDATRLHAADITKKRDEGLNIYSQ
jgi:hypothetical protein